MNSTTLYVVIALAGAFVYAGIGNLTASLWQRLTVPVIANEELKALRVMWWVFAPIGLALLLMYGLDYFLRYLFPPTRPN